MADLNQPGHIKAYFRDTIVANHIELSHFYSGKMDRLAQAFKNTIKTGEYVMFLEWPVKRYRDEGGSITAKMQPAMSILAAINKKNDSDQDTALEKCFEIIDDIIIRMRQETFDNGHIFRIQDITQVDPVYNYMIDNCIGCRMEFQIGDWVAVGMNNAKWSDL